MAKAAKIKAVEIEDKSSLHIYRTEIPNMVDEMGLSVYAFRLYVRFKRVAGDQGKCFYTTPQLAEQCKMSEGSVSKAKKELVALGLIAIDRDDKWIRDNITIVDVWPANFAYFADINPPVVCSPHEQADKNERSKNEPQEAASVHHMNSTVHVVNTPVHVVNVKEEPIKEEPIKEEPKGDCRLDADAPPSTDPWPEFLDALCWICHGHQETQALTEEQLGALTSEGKRMRDDEYTTADLREWMMRHWFKDWRWEKGKERPQPHVVRSSIPILRDSVAVSGSAAPGGLPTGDGRNGMGQYAPWGIPPEYEPPLPEEPPELEPPSDPPEPLTGLEATWAQCVTELGAQHPRFVDWLPNSTLTPTGDISLGKPVYRVTVDDPQAVGWLLVKGSSAMARNLSSLLGEPVTIEITAAEKEPTP